MVFLIYCGSSLRARHAIVANVSQWSFRCPSHGHISKTKQDRHIFIVEHYIEVGTADSIATFISSADAPPPGGDILISNKNMCLNINTNSCLTCRQITIVVNRARPSSKPQVLSTAETRVRPSKPAVNTHRPFRWQHLWYDAKVAQDADQFFLAVTVFLFNQTTAAQ